MIIEISVGNKKYKLNCRANEANDILNYADQLDQRVKELQQNIENASDAHYLVIAGLMLTQELQEQSQIHQQQIENLYTEDDLYEAISEQMENVVSYIEQLITKIEKL
jgi:cell division protein ZapA (FtsZ GTPase activity inhibitor)